MQRLATTRSAPERRALIALLVGSLSACAPSHADDAGPVDAARAPDAAHALDAALGADAVADDGPRDVANGTDGGGHDGDRDAGSGGHDGGAATLGNFPARFAAPYVETWNDNDLPAIATATGHKFFTLAFVINGMGTCNPTWNGYESLTANHYGAYITGLRALGGDVIVSFGGSAGTELGNACATVASLQAAYQRVITQFGLTWIDLDIESGAESDTPSIDRRNQAMHNLQMVNPGLRVSYTLAVARSGLPAAQIALLRNAQTRGVRVATVNVMAMDYGPCYADMGQAAIDAAAATRAQLASNGIAAAVGVTPMLGTNDVHCEVFSTTDAQRLETYAQGQAFIQTLAYWAFGADTGRANLTIFHSFH